ncbi:MAG: polynucleotide adenylyltransferase PcnB [Treponema sp.]|nr:polynucleotide adenylyltransferase PcnB [Treponema sp.]
MRIRYSRGKNGNPVKKAVVYTQDEHGISFSDVDRDAVSITERLKAAGYETYIVGGAVRDLILGKKPKDFDIVSSASPTRIKKLCRNARIIGHRFRLVHVYAGKKIFEVSTFRSLKEGPTSNVFGTIEEDVLRRDFTLNALFYDPGKQIVIDFVGGMKDIREKRIRPIIPLKTIFQDDPVRMIRAVKYGAAAGFKLPLTLRWRIKKESPLLADVSSSRLTEEIGKIVRSSQAALIVTRLEAMGLYRYLQPEASALMKGKPGFREAYIGGFEAAAAGEEAEKPGRLMSALIRPYLEGIGGWDAEDPQEYYKTLFAAARRFVLPMNPPRAELDQAVRLIFAEHGVTVKRSRFPVRLRDGGEEGEVPGSGLPGNPEAAPGRGSPVKRRGKPEAAGGEPAPDAAPAPRKRRRRKKRKSPGSGEAAASSSGSGETGGAAP